MVSLQVEACEGVIKIVNSTLYHSAIIYLLLVERGVTRIVHFRIQALNFAEVLVILSCLQNVCQPTIKSRNIFLDGGPDFKMAAKICYHQKSRNYGYITMVIFNKCVLSCLNLNCCTFLI